MSTRLGIRIAAAVVLAGALAGAAGASERVYKWTDKDGVVHYDQQPPTETESEAIKVRKGFSTPADDEPAQPSVGEKGDVTQEEYCATATKNFEMLAGSEVVTRKDDKGQSYVLPPEERTAERDRAKAAMDLYCPK